MSKGSSKSVSLVVGVAIGLLVAVETTEDIYKASLAFPEHGPASDIRERLTAVPDIANSEDIAASSPERPKCDRRVQVRSRQNRFCERERPTYD